MIDITLQIALAILAIGGSILIPFVTWWILPYIPFAIEALSNDPNRNRRDGQNHRDYQKSTFGFFTALQPGQVKIIERGDRFVRCIMRFDGHTFKGELSDNDIARNSEQYWEVVSSKKDGDFFPIVKPWERDINDAGGHLSRKPKRWEPILYAWSCKVYDVTGYVFTGIYPFQTVRTYPMDRYKLVKQDDGTLTTVVVEDYSDHYRVEDFQFPVQTKKADTKDKIPVDVLQNFIGRVINPYEVAYATDEDWSARLMTTVSDKVMSWTRYTPVDKVLSAKSAQGANALRREMISLTGDEHGENTGIRSYGLLAIGTNILDISATNSEDEKKLGELARARVQSDADKVLAEGQAAYVDEIAKASANNGEDGRLALQVRGRIETAQAAGENAIVFVGDNNQQTDPMLAALLREQRNKQPSATEREEE